MRLPLLCAAGILLSVCEGARDIVRSEPVALLDLQGLIEAAGIGEDFGTGMRIAKEVILYFHKPGVCVPDFAGLDNFMDHGLHYVLASADVDQVKDDLMEAFRITAEGVAATCPTAVVVRERSLVSNLEFEVIRPHSPQALAGLVVKTQQVTMGVMNELDDPIDVLYRFGDAPVAATSLLNVESRQEFWISTYRTTELIAVNSGGDAVQRYNSGEAKELGSWTVYYPGEFVVSAAPCDAETCGIVMRQEEEVTPQMERERAHHKENLVQTNRKQPSELPKFTDVGFKKIRVPDDVWDRIQMYYRRNKSTAPKLEKWSNANIFTNNGEAPSYMVNLPEEGSFKRYIFDGIRPILEEWVGCQLESTACYGIRVYTNGSWLVEHVDTRSTHAVSVIINVDQEVTDPWPLKIFDHAGTAYNVTMAPRDMVLYESATCVHGRPTRLNGQYYSNMFVHYRPVDHSKWKIYNE